LVFYGCILIYKKSRVLVFPVKKNGNIQEFKIETDPAAKSYWKSPVLRLMKVIARKQKLQPQYKKAFLSNNLIYLPME